jgi:CubicO group peptidase (beta-lactamase class C family)
VIPLERTKSFLESGIRDGIHPGAQLAVFLEGRLVGELALGYSDPDLIRPMDPSEAMAWLSAGKPVTALALAALIEDGKTSPDQPVADWIPEFAAGGKAGLTLSHLLLHTCGFRTADRLDPRLPNESALSAVCATPLESGWIPGTDAGYHRFASWLILGEIVRRISGKPLGDFLNDRILGPIGIVDSWLVPSRTNTAVRRAIHYDTRTGGTIPDPELNAPAVLQRERPGSGFHGPARDLARLYAAMLRPPAGWLRPETIRETVARHRTGVRDRTFQAVIDMGRGFLLNTPGMPYGYGPHASPDTFGHSGAQTGCGFADPTHQLAVAWLCNGMPGEAAHQRRQNGVNQAIYEDLGLARP